MKVLKAVFPILATCLLAACTTTKPLVSVAPDLTGKESSCAVVLENLAMASTDYDAKASTHKMKANTGEAIATVGSLFTFGATAFAYAVYEVGFQGDGGTEDAYREWTRWDNIAWMKGCKT